MVGIFSVLAEDGSKARWAKTLRDLLLISTVFPLKAKGLLRGIEI
jgi:hypothetical protein